MRIPISLFVVGLVLAEIAAFILVGQVVGVLGTLALTVLSSISGAVLLRRQGLATLVRVRADIAARRDPARPLAEAAMLAAGALLMIVPGFITSLIGLMLFVPAVRGRLWGRLAAFAARRTTSMRPIRPAHGPVIELESGQYSANPRPPSPWRRGDRAGP